MEASVKTRPILKAKDITLSSNRVFLAGCTPHAGQESDQDPPTVILEKGPDDRIRKITVQCPCGRHAELICMFDEEPAAGKKQP